jgi:phage head maturation protease
MNDTLIAFGSAVKALGDGRVGGYLITFSDAASPDLTGEYFTKDTDYDLADGDTRSVYYAHGLDEQLGVKKIGRFTAKTDAIGIWVEAQLNLRDEYEKAIANLAAKGALGWSSGAPAHLVARKSVETKDGATVREITHWPIAEASLTPSPAEPRNGAVAMKSLPALLGLESRKTKHDVAPAAMPFAECIETALAAVADAVQRAEAIKALCIKDARPFSMGRRKRLREMHTQMQVAHAAMGTHIATMQALLNETEPAAKTNAEIEQIYLRMLAREAEALGVELSA